MGREHIRRRLPDLLLAALVGVVVVGLLAGGRPQADRADQLAGQLRCPVCQSESVADSRSDTALAMQDRIDELIAQGWSDERIVAHFVARYGDWIVLDPPFDTRSAALWLLPPAVAAGALLGLRRWRQLPTSPPDEVDSEQRGRLAAAIDELRRREEADGA